MKAMTLNEYGSSKHFTASEVAKPQVKAGQVLVKIAATSVNPVDYKIRSAGEDLPFAPALPAILGMDFAGTVEAVGEGVTHFAVGDEVYGCAGGLADLPGTLAEYISADARLMAKKPKNLSMQEAAALPLVSITAYEGLTRAGVKAGSKVLVHGGSGGVGHIAVQLAKHMGADVYATGGGDKQLELIASLGATGINYKTESVDEYVNQYTDGNGFDVIYDTVGEANLLNSFQAIGLNGQIATTSTMSAIDLTMAHIKGATLHVVFMLLPMLHNTGREVHGQILQQVAEIAESDSLTPVLTEQQFTLENTGAAHDYAESGQGMGKVVISIA
ncbi:zinc-dependent alcohol dehydrogenase family protein [Gilvimarinus chinensis]|uniref:zinc-dependent alcohol dehydrogenase family protein n=1 Tax=Gilvimarinus chinensis TaxID=396005 RepID=UPI0004783CDC|nr:zinc-dependent alcohol dehydrogenase family protein [Gilvimarinus chinensis]